MRALTPLSMTLALSLAACTGDGGPSTDPDDTGETGDTDVEMDWGPGGATEAGDCTRGPVLVASDASRVEDLRVLGERLGEDHALGERLLEVVDELVFVPFEQYDCTDPHGVVVVFDETVEGSGYIQELEWTNTDVIVLGSAIFEGGTPTAVKELDGLSGFRGNGHNRVTVGGLPAVDRLDLPSLDLRPDAEGTTRLGLRLVGMDGLAEVTTGTVVDSVRLHLWNHGAPDVPTPPEAGRVTLRIDDSPGVTNTDGWTGRTVSRVEIRDAPSLQSVRLAGNTWYGDSGSLSLIRTGLTRLDLDIEQRPDLSLFIRENADLEVIDGFPTDSLGNVDIEDNPSLTTISGFVEATEVWDIELVDLPRLTDLSAFAAVERFDAVNNPLQVHNTALVDITLPALRELAAIELSDNPDLETLEGLGGVEAMTHHVHVLDSPRLRRCEVRAFVDRVDGIYWYTGLGGDVKISNLSDAPCD